MKNAVEDIPDVRHRLTLRSTLRNLVLAVTAISQRQFIVLGIITLFGLLLRVYHLAYKPLWLDEAVLYWISNGSFSNVITQNATRNSAPPLYPLLIKLIAMIGDSEGIIRSVSACAGVLSIPAIYFLSRKVLSVRTSYLSSLLVAVAPTQVQYSQELREYSLTFLIATLVLIVFIEFVENPTWTRTAWLALLFVWAICTQYGLGLLLLSLNFVFLTTLFSMRNRAAVFGKWMMVQIAALVAVVFVYQVAFKYQIVAGGFGTGPGSGYLASGYPGGSLFSMGQLALSGTINIASFALNGSLFLFATTLGLLVLLVTQKNRVIAGAFLMPFLCTFVAACFRTYPYVGMRQAMFLLPGLYVGAAYGIDFVGKLGARKLVVTILALALIIPALQATYWRLQEAGSENIRPIISELKASVEPGDRIYVYYGAEPAFRYYYGDNTGNEWMKSAYGRVYPERYLLEIERIAAEPGRVWMVFSHCWSNECTLIPENAAKFRNVQLINEQNDAFLFLLDN